MNTALRLRLIFAALMSLWMSSLMTAFVVWLNLGFTDYLAHWRHAFLSAWPAAFTVVVLFGPTLQKLSQRLNARLPQSATGHNLPTAARIENSRA